MAIMHLSVKTGGKGKAASHAQYIEREGKYSKKEDLTYSESGNMPKWAIKNPSLFWKKADLHERENGRTYTELEVSLPRELQHDKQIELIKEFISNTIGDDHPYTFAIHAPKAKDGELNPHAHIMFTERRLDGIERSSDLFFKRYNSKNPDLGGAKKDRLFSSRFFVSAVRNEWTATANHFLEKNLIDARIDHRSYKDRGIDLLSQNTKKMYDKTIKTFNYELANDIKDIQKINGKRIIDNPEIALRYLTDKSSTFTKSDIEKFIFSHTDGIDQYLNAYNAVLNSPQLVKLTDEKNKYTSEDMFSVENNINTIISFYNNEKFKSLSFSEKQEILKVEKSKTFNDEQKKAFAVLTGSSSLAITNGAAGTGKSYVLSAVNEAFSKNGYHVIGAAVQAVTAQSMEIDSGIESKTIASLLSRLRWEVENNVATEKRIMNEKTVLFIDEAGMVGSRDMNDILKYAKMYKCKVRLVGDAYQLSSVSAGDVFANIQKQLRIETKSTLNKIMRQKDEKHKEASILMSSHKIEDALNIYKELNNISTYTSQDEARKAVVEAWSKSEGTSIMLAYTNDDVNAMNKFARAIKKEQGLILGDDVKVTTVKGKINIASGDEIVFLENNKEMKVLNGTRAKIESLLMTDNKLVINAVTDNGIKVQFDAKEYKAFNHAYASTIHKAQGITVDNAFLLASNNMNANLLYVATTRHRKDLKIVYSNDQFKSFSELKSILAKSQNKTYSTNFDVEQERTLIQTQITQRETLANKNFFNKINNTKDLLSLSIKDRMTLSSQKDKSKTIKIQ